MAAGGGVGSLPEAGNRVRRFRPALPARPPDRRRVGSSSREAAATAVPAEFRLATTAEVLAGAALVGRSILYRWPVQGWVLGKVVRVSRAAGLRRP